jgi:hypothetical protein
MKTRRPSRCPSAELPYASVLQALPAGEVAAAEAHIASCRECRRALESLRPVVERFVSWPTDVLRPPTSLRARLALRIAEETGYLPMLPPPLPRWSEPDWEPVAPGIDCKLLATDAHLLAGELWIDARKLLPGDYNYGAPGAGDDRVWSETGCTCLLVTSTDDVLR